jgi:protein phosphatase
MIETRVGNASDVGLVRTTNEDYFGASRQLRYGQVILVCDGMGGHEGGEQASRLVVEEILGHFREPDPAWTPDQLIRKAFVSANTTIGKHVAQHKDVAGMGTTVVLLLLKGHHAWIAHVGDSRIYRIQQKIITRLTRDHSLVQQMVDEGMLSEDEARDHPRRNTITRALGAGNKNTMPDITGPIALNKSDRFILCTDGLSMYFSDEEIRQIAERLSPQEACLALITEARARGGEDNITVQVVDILRVSGVLSQHAKRAIVAGVTVIAILVLSGAAFVFSRVLYWYHARGSWPVIKTHATADRASQSGGHRTEERHASTGDSTKAASAAPEQTEVAKDAPASGQKTSARHQPLTANKKAAGHSSQNGHRASSGTSRAKPGQNKELRKSKTNSKNARARKNTTKVLGKPKEKAGTTSSATQ